MLGGQAKILGVTQMRAGIGKSGEDQRNPRKDFKNMVEEKHLLVA